MKQHSNKIFFPNLDGLRFIAFFAVFFHHTLLPAVVDPTRSSHLFRFLNAQKQNGALGVNLFFVLSGFLITYLLINEKDRLGRINIPNFYMRRVLRIWPLYFLVVGIGFFLFPYVKHYLGQAVNETATLPYYVLFISNFQQITNGFADSIVLNVLWSVGIEEQFYIIWPLLLSIIPQKHFLKAMAALILVTVVFRSFHAGDFKTIHLHTLSVFSDLVIGGIVAWLAYYRQWFRTFLEGLSRRTILLVYIAGFVVILFDYLLFTTPAGIVAERFVFALFFAFIIAEQNFCSNSFYKMSNNRWLSKWGNYTYGLYCLHTVAIIISHIISEKILHLQNEWALMGFDYAMGLPLSLLMAYLSYTYFESPFLRLKNKFAYFTK